MSASADRTRAAWGRHDFAVADRVPEPDVVDDGVEVWLVDDDLDIVRDATSVIHGPTYRIGSREVSEATLRLLRDAATAALADGGDR